MATTTRRTRGKAVLKGADDIPLLGNIATFTLPDAPVKGNALVRAWADAGLEIDGLPQKRTGAHIFMSACRSVETRKALTGTKNTSRRVEVSVNEAVHNDQKVAYTISRRIKDMSTETVVHQQSMSLVYDKALDAITVEQLADYASLRGLEEAIRKDFAKNQRTIPGQKVRNAVRDQLLAIGAQNLRRKAGGLYFVPDEYLSGRQMLPSAPILEGLRKALTTLYDDRADFYTIPLADDAEQRAMVAKHFAINATEKSNELMEKAINRVRAGKGQRGVRSDLLAGLYNERRLLMGAVDQFDAIVGLERKTIDANLRDLDKALADLQALADEA